jgi:hypothetical protein
MVVMQVVMKVITEVTMEATMEVTMEAVTEEEQLQAQETPYTCQLAVIQPMRRRSDLDQA